MSHEAVARRYGKAIFDLAQGAGDAAAVSRELLSFAEAYESSRELRAALGNPLVDVQARDALLADLFGRLGLSPLAQNAIRFVVQKRRTEALPAIAAELARSVDEASGVLRADVTSASPLEAGYLDRLRGELEKRYGRKVALTTSVDPSLIAGIVTRVGDTVIDGSLRARLQSFREMRGA